MALETAPDTGPDERSSLRDLLTFLLGLYLFLLALDGFKLSWRLLFSVDQATHLVIGNVSEMLSNPLLGFFLGILVTSLIQSSSATIAIIISFVALQDAPIELCIPMILGANIGTTVTNTLVGLGHGFQPDEFRRVVPAALVDDLFKILNVSIFLSLELGFGLLSRLSHAVVAFFEHRAPATEAGDPLLPDVVEAITAPLIDRWADLGARFSDLSATPILSGLIAFALLISGLQLMGATMQHVFQRRARAWIRRSLRGRFRGAGVGFAACWLLQSSSVTTSLMIPLVAQKMATLRQAYYVAIGASVGTTSDAGQIVAYLKYGVPGLAAGVVHITVNLVGALAFLLVPGLRELPLHAATAIGERLGRTRYAPMVFGLGVMTLFYGAPLLLSFVL